MRSGRTTLKLSIPAATRDRWQAAADVSGYSLAEWLRQAAEAALDPRALIHAAKLDAHLRAKDEEIARLLARTEPGDVD